MNGLKVDYFSDKESLNFIWETIIERHYFVEELVISVYTLFPKELNEINSYYLSNCNSYLELYYKLNGLNILEDFVSSFDYGIWEEEEVSIF